MVKIVLAIFTNGDVVTRPESMNVRIRLKYYVSADERAEKKASVKGNKKKSSLKSGMKSSNDGKKDKKKKKGLAFAEGTAEGAELPPGKVLLDAARRFRGLSTRLD